MALGSSYPAQVRYSTGAVVLHWLIALALAFQLALGFAMPHDERGFAMYQLHKSVGITVLVLTLARFAWRLTHRPPPAVERGFGGFLAKAVHTLLYVFMVGAPLTGWAMVSTDASRIPTVLFGAIPLPHLPLPGTINEPMEEAHELLAWLGLALILLHILGALRHQLLLKDGLLRRMGPGGSAALAGLLGLLVVATYFGTGMKVSGDVMKMGGYRAEHEGKESVPAPAAATAAPTALASAEPTDTATPTDEATEADAEAGPPPVWTIQRGGRLGFSVGNGDSSVRGSFSDWNGAIKFDPDHPETADIRIDVKLASASLGDATQDEMLQGGDFFNSSANPTATWRSTSVRQTGPGRYSASGTLSLRGTSRPQALTFRLTGDGLKRHVEGSGSIDRNAFGIGSGEAASGLASSVSVSFAFDAVGKAP